jgi:hypothetical protein
MARPRVFISSTFYDLKQVRAELERFVSEMGYEPILNERGHIPYGKDEALEDYCYREIRGVDILVSVIGGRFGSESAKGEYSISQTELKSAHEQNKQIYIFVEKGVLAEHQTYKLNKDHKEMKYSHVNDARVYKFIDEVFALHSNNAVAGFEFARDITDYLREQWAGLFQSLMHDSARQKEALALGQLQASVQTLGQLVTYLTEDKKKGDAAIQSILTLNHPVFAQLATLLKIDHRVTFLNKDELARLLKVKGYRAIDEDEWDDPGIAEWTRSVVVRGNPGGLKLAPKEITLLRINGTIFDSSGALRVFTPADWKPDWVTTEVSVHAPTPSTEEEVPF